MTRNHDLPNKVTQAGLDFSYATWTADTALTLCRVPWDSTYRDVVRFADRQALDTYLFSKSTTQSRITSASYARVNQPIRVHLPFNVALEYNYIRAHNPRDGRSFYYFIIDVQHIAPNTTQLLVQLDVWQTYGDFELGRCYVERGHIGIANENNFDGFGRRYLTVPEGFDTGTDYTVVSVAHRNIMGTGTPDAPDSFKVLIASTISLYPENRGTADDPIQKAATGATMHGYPTGVDLYIADDMAAALGLLEDLKDFPWISRGIFSITAIPNYDYTNPYDQIDYGIVYYHDPIRPGVYQVAPNTSGLVAPGNKRAKVYGLKNSWRHLMDITVHMGQRYVNLRKFWTYPYMQVEVTTSQGTPLVLKPENWDSHDAEIGERISLIPGAQRMMFYPSKYNASDRADYESYGQINHRDPGDFLDRATLIESFPQIMAVNDNAALGLASSAHSIAFAHQSADWSQTKALQGADLSLSQANESLKTSNQMTTNQTRAATNQTNLQNMTNWTQGVAGGIANTVIGTATGGPGAGASAALGSAANAVQTGIGNAANSASTQISNDLALRQNMAGIELGSYIANSNAEYAQFAAKGDYANTIGALNARVRDTELAPPTTVGQIGGDVLLLVDGLYELTMRVKMIDTGSIARIGEIWLRYGYAINEYVHSPPLQCMSRFTYWKMQESYIIHETIPEQYRLTLRGILEKGVTVWNDPTDIGVTDPADNRPLEGITYG